ncbi:MAG: SCP2 sterol-binding domain-containing protein [Desulfomonile sp.]|jgi:putative sterol carrier protein|nr:SCP2 sterol-binding domain-containing protein [Deltaproteobacteria bacterium]
MELSTVSEVFENMPTVFNVAAASGLDAVFQFSISGDEAGDYYVVIKDNACKVEKGVHDSPSVSLSLTGQDWLAICNGKLDGMTAFMSGKLKATGNIMLAQRIKSLFPM